MYEFSLGSKLLHIKMTHLLIYDSKVEIIYLRGEYRFFGGKDHKRKWMSKRVTEIDKILHDETIK